MEWYYKISTKPITPRNYICALTQIKLDRDCKCNITSIKQLRCLNHIHPYLNQKVEKEYLN